MVESALKGNKNSDHPRKRHATAAAAEGQHLWDNLSDSEDESDKNPEPIPAPAPAVSDAAVEDALVSYWSSPRIPQHADPFNFWRENESAYPAVSMIAKATFSCPSGSVDSERLFSTAGNIITSKRGSLKPENAEDQIFLAKNLRFFDFKY